MAPAVADGSIRYRETIVDELNAVQGSPVDLGGYYQPDHELVTAAMRPSARFNQIIEGI